MDLAESGVNQQGLYTTLQGHRHGHGHGQGLGIGTGIFCKISIQRYSPYSAVWTTCDIL